MIRSFTRIISIFIFIVLAVMTAAAQIESPASGDSQKKEDVPKGIQENLAKQRIEREKKDFADLLARGEEAVKISGELEKSFSQSNQLSVEDRKKLDRLEKIIKKIRNEIGANDDEENDADTKPLSVVNALKTLQDNASTLVQELKKNTRYTVSVVAVESSNLLLKIVRFLRIGKN